MMRQTAFLSYTMTTADAANPRGIIPIGRQFDFIGDVETELMILNDDDESLCLGYEDFDIYDEVRIGDHMEFRATMLKVGNTSRTCLVQSFKLAAPTAENGGMTWFDEPKLVAEGKVTLVVRKDRQRGPQPDGAVKDPWRKLD